MTKIVPHQLIFDRAKKFENGSKGLIYLSAIISLVLIFLHPASNNFALLLNAVNCVLIAAALIFDQVHNYLFFEAGKVKRLDFLDNSLGSNFSGIRSQEYFSNDKLDPGIYKMAVNCFENSFFSTQISVKMITSGWLKALIILVIFIFNASEGNAGIVNLLFQLSLPILLMQQAIRITLFSNRVSETYNNFLRLFNDLKMDNYTTEKIPEIIKIVLDYQTTLTWSNITLNAKVFKKENDHLSQKWEELKSEYNII